MHSQAALEGEQVQLRAGAQPAEMAFLSVDGPGGRLALANEPGRTDEQALTCFPPIEGQLHTASVILLGEWVGAEVKLDVPAGVLLIRQGQKQVSVPIGGQDSR